MLSEVLQLCISSKFYTLVILQKFIEITIIYKSCHGIHTGQLATPLGLKKLYFLIAYLFLFSLHTMFFEHFSLYILIFNLIGWVTVTRIYIKAHRNVNKGLKKVKLWLDSNMLALYKGKTNFVLFHSAKKIIRKHQTQNW